MNRPPRAPLSSSEQPASEAQTLQTHLKSPNAPNWSDHVLSQQPVTQLSELPIPTANIQSPKEPEFLLTQTAQTRDNHSQQQHIEPVQNLNIPEDTAHKRMLAGLLAMFVGGLGVHKFYLGLNQAGIILLSVHLGSWFLAMFISVITLGLGILVTLPFVIMLSILISIFTFIESLVYLTKSDQDFYHDYILKNRHWL